MGKSLASKATNDGELYGEFLKRSHRYYLRQMFWLFLIIKRLILIPRKPYFFSGKSRDAHANLPPQYLV